MLRNLMGSLWRRENGGSADLRAVSANPASRVAELLARYGEPGACAAYLLCDRHDPNAIAFRVIGQDLAATDLSYGELRARSERVAASLHGLGIRSGDRIATLMGKSVDYLVALMAIWRLGAVHVPLFTAFAPPAISFRLNRSRTKLIFCDAAQRAKLLRGEDIPADPSWRVVVSGAAAECMAGAIAFSDLLAGKKRVDAVALGGDAPIIEVYTSGTTGRPKGVAVPLRMLAALQIYAEYGLGVRHDDVFWNAADPGWAYGLYFGILASLSTGAKGILLEGGFSPDRTFAVLSRYGVTNFTAAPTVYRALRVSGAVLPADLKLRCLSSAGEPLTPEINEWSIRALGLPVHDQFGQTEVGMLINNHHHPALRRPLKAGSMGRAMPGWKAAILKPDSDEIAATGEVGRVAMDIAASPLALFRGYIDDAEKSAEKFSADGRWYLTGDVGLRDKEDYFFFSARDDDVIIMAGYRIGPFEVESVILTHPAVSECAVIAVPDAVRGEILIAIVVLREGSIATAALTAGLQDLVRQRYAAHAYPRQVHYAGSLPKTPSGKIQRFVLRQQLAARTGAGQAGAQPGGA